LQYAVDTSTIASKWFIFLARATIHPTPATFIPTDKLIFSSKRTVAAQ